MGLQVSAGLYLRMGVDKFLIEVFPAFRREKGRYYAPHVLIPGGYTDDITRAAVFTSVEIRGWFSERAQPIDAHTAFECARIDLWFACC